jgi:hypothetical protein
VPPATHGPAYGAAGRRAPMIEGRGRGSVTPNVVLRPRSPAGPGLRGELRARGCGPCRATGRRGHGGFAVSGGHRRRVGTSRGAARLPVDSLRCRFPPCAACMVYRSQARRILTCGGHVCSLLLGGAACSIILSAGESSTSAPTCSHQSYVVMTMRVRISHPRRVLNMKPCVCGSAS